MKLLVTANSPGEVAWIRPLAAALKRRGGSCDVLLYPCTFATGKEAEVLRSFPGVERIWSTAELMGLWWSGHSAYPTGTPLLHLGGDLMYTAAFRARHRWRCWSYLWARPWWDRFFEGYFSRNSASTRGLLKRGVRPEKILEVGDFVVDTCRMAVPQQVSPRPRCLAVLPGSRPEEARRLIPFYARVGELLRDRCGEFDLIAPISPFLSHEMLIHQLERPRDLRFDGAAGQLQEKAYVTASGLRLQLLRENHLAHLAEAQLVVSLPGTKTAEAGALGVPVLCIVPLNAPEFLPSHGLLGLLDWLPGGKRLKGQLILRQRHRIGLLAQPNQLLGRALLPEMVQELSAEQVASQILSTGFPEAKLESQRRELRQVYDPFAGCSKKILDSLLGASGP